jgi:hypothetical protein
VQHVARTFRTGAGASKDRQQFLHTDSMLLRLDLDQSLSVHSEREMKSSGLPPARP